MGEHEPIIADRAAGGLDCPISDLLQRLGDKWSLLVLVALAESEGGRLRFSEALRAVGGISQRMLTTTLRHLERDGILTRRVYPEVPPRVEYTLTARGRGLLVPVKALIEWLHAEWPEIARSRLEYDERAGARSEITAPPVIASATKQSRGRITVAAGLLRRRRSSQ